MAEAIARRRAGQHANVASAGSAPRGRVHPEALDALRRHGYSTDSLSSKDMNDVQPLQPDVVISVCDQAAGEACPLWLQNTPRISWGMPDPSAQPGPSRTKNFDRAIELLEQRIDSMLDALQQETSEAGRLERLQAIAQDTPT